MNETKVSALVQRYLHEPEFRRFIMAAGGCSMAPEIVSGDRLHMERAERDPEIGEVVLVQGRSGRFFLHRVNSAKPNLRTKGDNCEEADEEITKVLAILQRIEKTPRSRLRRVTMAIRRLLG